MSRLIKSHYSPSQDIEKKVIHLQPLRFESLKEQSPETTILRLKAEAEKLLVDAKLRAEKIVSEANANLQTTNEMIAHSKKDWESEKINLIELANQEGFQAGYKQGEQAAKEQYSETLQEANRVVEQSKIDFVEQVEQSEEVILKLAVKIAGKILQVHLEDKKEDFVKIVKHAIKEVKDFGDINIIVHPFMYELVVTQKDELRALFNREKNLFIYPSVELQETSCIIESSFGRIDASIDSQLAEMKVKLLELLQEE
ncbi:flagellar assembly protein FliH [Bacillus sp. DJP31]|uniref:flagellar assembly protein FliH n=1 Tax=Bacillus sp. DJP31 TaxID=3409789 RepID=UPI003BB77DCE